MHVWRNVFILILLLSGLNSTAAPDALSSCLSQINPDWHRLDRQDAVRLCFASNSEKVAKSACYSSMSRYKHLLNTSQLYSQALNSCFYEAGQFKTMNTCLADSRLFKNAGDHDEAVFYCYQTFQDKLDKKSCLLTAQKMIFPAKQDYLTRHCLQN